MYRYALLNIIFLVVTVLVVKLSRVELSAKPIIKTIVVLVVLTAIFDSIIIALNLVSYDLRYILGFYIGRVPLEDFAYTVVAGLIVPVLWERNKSP